MSSNKTVFIAAILGVAIGAGAMMAMQSGKSADGEGQTDNKAQKPLYWVAPMDSNYRRDKPGLSPMGMDLVPVYAEDNSSDDYGPGAVTIAPHVVNNLGVRTTEVEMAPLEKVISTVGLVQYDEDKLVHIHPRVAGWIEQLFVNAEGDPVAADQPLYTLYSPELVNAQEELLIAVKRNNATLIKAAKARLSALQISDSFIANLQKTRKVRQSITFYAPQSGFLAGLKIREGFYVQPGNTLMSIGQLEQVWVEAEVFERDAAFVKAGLPVTMTLDYLPGKSWQGAVDYVYPSLNAQNRTLRVRLKFNNADYQLKPNMFAQVAIETESQGNSIIVPIEAVIRTGKQDRVVLALGEGQFKSIEVQVGAIEQDRVSIIDGLVEGDNVVISAQFLIDSESSKSSDFKRMQPTSVPTSVWMEGEINAVMRDQRVANISHGPAEDWGWPEMTMDFEVGVDVDINALQAGQTLHFEVTKTDEGMYQVTGIHIMSEPTISSATVKGVINVVNTQNRVLNISREAIEKWDRPADTMDFAVDERIDLGSLKAGDEVIFTFEIQDDFVIVEIAAASSAVHKNH